MNDEWWRGQPGHARVKGRKVVIKVGGSSIGGPTELDRFAADIAKLVSLGIRPVIVHGGGPEISEEMKRRGLTPKKVAGLRVTDDATLRVAAEVLGAINTQIVNALKSAGLRSIGLAGAEGGMMRCAKIGPAAVADSGGEVCYVDLGFVGEVTQVNAEKLALICTSGFVPVIYPICATRDGQLMNVNADTAAAHIARALHSDEMVLVTDVPGIMREFGNVGSVIRQVTSQEVECLVHDGVVSDGMIPKVEACRLAVDGGVKAAHMVCGREPHSIIDQLLNGRNCGTTIVP
jgi:acetylglutamate kinase